MSTLIAPTTPGNWAHAQALDLLFLMSQRPVFCKPSTWVECYLKLQVLIYLSVIKHRIKVVPVFLGALRNSTICKCISLGTVQGCADVVALSLDGPC